MRPVIIIRLLCLLWVITILFCCVVFKQQNEKTELLASENGRLRAELENRSKAATHVIPHRGASGEEPEHTFAAYDLAIDYGARYIEQDLCFSKEGTLFVSHDSSSDKWTGEMREITSFDDAELMSFGLLRLEDVFERYFSSDVVFVIETRSVEDKPRGKTQAEALVELLDEFDLGGGRVIVQAWETDSLNTIKSYDPGMKTMYLTAEQEGIRIGAESGVVDIVCAIADLMDAENIKCVHDAGKLYCAYTLNTVEDIKRAIESNVDMYFTNYVAKGLMLEEKYRKS